MMKLARDGVASKKPITQAILGFFKDAYKPDFHMSIALSQKVSFMPIAPLQIVSR